MTREPPAHLLHFFATFVPAGPQVRTAKLLAGFGSRYRHTIVAMDGQTEGRELLDPALDWRFVEAPPRAGSLMTTARTRAMIRREAPDLVLTYNWGAIDAAVAARSLGLGPRLVHHEDGFRPDEAQAPKLRRSLARRLALSGIARVVVISKNLERVSSEHWKLAPGKVLFIPNGIDVESFEEADGNPALRAELGIGEGALVLGAVGHLREEKNLARLLRAAAALPEELGAHVLLVGDGPEREALEQEARRLGIAPRVHFAGYQGDPRAHFRAMDVFCLTSNTEQMPMALLEAMASSLPAVGTDVGDVGVMVCRGEDFVVPLGEEGVCVRALTDRLARLARDRELRVQLGRENRERTIRSYSTTEMVRAYLEVYEAALSA